MIDLRERINTLIPDAQFSEIGGNWDSIDWWDNRDQPTLAEVTAVVIPDVSTDDVNTERHRRQMLPVTVKVSADTSEEKIFQVDIEGEGKSNITNLVLMAGVKNTVAIHTPFDFTDADDNDLILTNNEIIEMGLQAGFAYSAIHQKSRVIKKMETIPIDYKDDSYWT